MAYKINKYNGDELTQVPDGYIDRLTCDLALIGKNVAGYGELQNENFVNLLESFAGSTRPQRPIKGQVWYDTSTEKLKFHTGRTSEWKTAGGVEYGPEPLNPTNGDLWFSTVSQQLNVYSTNGATSGWVSIGPQAADDVTNQLVAALVMDDQSIPKTIIKAMFGDTIAYVISTTEFTLHGDTPITGFSSIKKGITLPYVNSNGVSDGTQGYVVWGTASDAKRLNGKDASFYLTTESTSLPQRVSFEKGISVGTSGDLVIGQSPATIESKNDNGITFVVKDGNSTVTPLVITKDSIYTNVESLTLGTQTKRWSTIFANNVDATGTITTTNLVATTITPPAGGALQITGNVTGVSSQADTLKTTDNGAALGYYRADVKNIASTIAARDAAGAIRATTFKGIATSAQYADLAEKYIADSEYAIGTVVVIGGAEEVTESAPGIRALGVVSEKPGFIMNNDQARGTYIAIKGRVPAFVTGPVTKGDRLISGPAGTAIATSEPHPDTFAIARETNLDPGVKLVDVSVI